MTAPSDILRASIALSVVLVGCAGRVVGPEAQTTACTTAAPSSEQPALPDLAWLPTAEVVRIERAWGGLTGAWVARYHLRRQADAFVGLASLVVVEPGRETAETPTPQHTFRTSALEIEVQVDAMESFLGTLAGTTVRGSDAPDLVRVIGPLGPRAKRAG